MVLQLDFVKGCYPISRLSQLSFNSLVHRSQISLSDKKVFNLKKLRPILR